MASRSLSRRGGMNVFQAMRSGASPWPAITLDQIPYWMSQFGYQGLGYGPAMIQTIQQNRETIQADFLGFINGAYKTNSMIFSCMLCRSFLFSEARFQFQRLTQGRPGVLFGTPDLDILEHPWPNATTGDLLLRIISDVDLAGNFYGIRTMRLDRKGPKIARLRPDWVTIIKGSYEDAGTELDIWDPTAELIGYIYTPGGPGSGIKPKTYLPEEVCHMAPYLDPIASYRGMSWVQPVLTEILGDRAMTTHKQEFFLNGAPQPLDAKVLTPSGWVSMGDVQVGDQVIGRDGHAAEILGVFPQGEQDIYRVTFTDGTNTECTMNHLWGVANCRDRQLGRLRSLPLSQIVAEGLRYPTGAAKWTVPFCEPVEFERSLDRLPLDPYLMGLLIGDGSFSEKGITLSVGNQDLPDTRELLAEVVPPGAGWIGSEKSGCWDLRFNGGHRYTPSPVHAAVKELGLIGVKARHKYVPHEYLRASVQDRLSLLQGLVDSDGSVDRKQGSVEISTASRRLVGQVVELVRSLGGTASFSEPSADHSAYRVRVQRLPSWMIPCRLERKVKLFRVAKRPRHRAISKVEFVGRKEAQCIYLDHEEHLYVTDDYIVTHNTPNLVVTMDTGKMDRKTFGEWVELFDNEHSGALNAYKTLYLGQGANATVVGSTIKDLDYATVQGGGELRIAMAAGIHPVILGTKDGLAAASLNNFANARRLMSDKTLRPLWRNMAGSMETLITAPPGSRLWYDDRDIPFLKEDEADEADILLTKSTAMRLLVDAGYDPDSVVLAIDSNDIKLLKHSGLYSVQLQPPNNNPTSPVDPQNPTSTDVVPTNGNGNGDGKAQPQPKNPKQLATSGKRANFLSNISSPEQLAKALLEAKATAGS